MRVLYLSNRVPWFGAHTGYEQLPHYAESAGLSTSTISPNSTLISRAMGKVVSTLRGHGRISQADAAARWRLERALDRDPAAIGHILYGEEHLPFWADAIDAARKRCFLTLHQPSSTWTDSAKRAALARLPHVIVLWQRELDWFRAQTKSGHVHFIPHGVDIDFFSPAPPAESAEPRRFLYAGVHLRNTAMLERIVTRLGDRAEFDFLVPEKRRAEPALARLAAHPNIRWHANLGDEALRALYRSAHALLLPMNDSGANTAVVEALACGLPPVTTDVGGIRDYGGGTVFPVVENNDDDGMIALLEKYLDESGWRDDVSRRCRAFAESALAWPLIARRHAEIYREAGQ